MPDMLFILLLALLLFGPKKIPEITRQLARFKKATDDVKAQLEAGLREIEAEAQKVIPSGSTDLNSVVNPLARIRDEVSAAIVGNVGAPDRGQRDAHVAQTRDDVKVEIKQSV